MFYVHLYLIPMYRCCIYTYSIRGSCTEAAGNYCIMKQEQKQQRVSRTNHFDGKDQPAAGTAKTTAITS